MFGRIKDRNFMFTMPFTALFVEENRQIETKHSLVDARNNRMPQTNDKKVGTLEISEPKRRCSTF